MEKYVSNISKEETNKRIATAQKMSEQLFDYILEAFDDYNLIQDLIADIASGYILGISSKTEEEKFDPEELAIVCAKVEASCITKMLAFNSGSIDKEKCYHKTKKYTCYEEEED